MFLMLSGDCVMGEPHGMDGWGKKCSCATSHGASRKMIHQPWPLFFVPETKEMNTEVQRWAHVGRHRKDALAWSFPGELGTCLLIPNRVSMTGHINKLIHVQFGKTMRLLGSLKSPGEGLLQEHG